LSQFNNVRFPNTLDGSSGVTVPVVTKSLRVLRDLCIRIGRFSLYIGFGVTEEIERGVIIVYVDGVKRLVPDGYHYEHTRDEAMKGAERVDS